MRGAIMKITGFNDFHGSGVNSRSWVFLQCRLLYFGYCIFEFPYDERRRPEEMPPRADKPWAGCSIILWMHGKTVFCVIGFYVPI